MMKPEFNLALIARRIESYCAKTGSSDRKLSLAAGEGEDAVRKIRDGSEPKIGRFANLARAMGISLDALIDADPAAAMPWDVDYSQGEPGAGGFSGAPYSAPAAQAAALADRVDLFEELADALAAVYEAETVAIAPGALARLAFIEFAEVLDAGDSDEARRGAIRHLAGKTRKFLRSQRAAALRGPGLNEAGGQ